MELNYLTDLRQEKKNEVISTLPFSGIGTPKRVYPLAA